MGGSMIFRSHIQGTLLGILFGVFLGAGCVHAQKLSYTGSMQYATGSYFFSENTESFSFVNGMMISGDKTTISFSVPFIYQNSPWISYGATGYIPTGGSQHGSLTDSTGRRPGKGGGGSGMGKASSFTSRVTSASDSIITLPDTASYQSSSFGDPTIYANINLFRSSSGYTSLQLNSNLKIPITDPANGYGTGEWDFGVGTSLSQRFLGNNYLYLDITKWWFGDMPDLELQDPISFSIGLSRSLAQGKWLLNTTLSGFTEIINDYEPPLNAGIGIGYFVSSKVALNSTFTMGLTESSSDAAIGLGWSVKF
jgi:hypothetical protein